MRSHSWVRWVLVCLVSVVIPAAAVSETRSKSIADCTLFDQQDKDESTVQFKITNSCTIPVDCSVSWRVVCAPTSKKRRAVHNGARKWQLEAASNQSTEASAAVCGDDGWSIEGVTWSCQPNQD